MTPIEIVVIGVVGLLLLGPSTFAKVGGELRRATGEARAAVDEATAALTAELPPTLVVELRGPVLDGRGRPLASWHRVPSSLPRARCEPAGELPSATSDSVDEPAGQDAQDEPARLAAA